MQYDFKCDRCGNVMRAAIRPRLCDRCSAGRRHIHKVDRMPPATK